MAVPQVDPEQVRVLDEGLSYADGAEDELIRILRSATDRSARSDELAAHIHDWPTLYHLSPLRANLLTPLQINPGDRVLEIGCGTGVNVRTLAERGAEVVGVEGTVSRATAARIRNLEFDSVEILAGDVVDYVPESTFDVVVVVGVLEYVPSGLGGLSEPVDFLELCASFLKEDGILVLAIENKLGLKYLLSFPEDHLGLPWVGLEGYRNGQPRTWSRLELSEMFTQAGFRFQEFLNPFPDYKLPTAVFRDRVYESGHGRELVKNFVRRPVVDYSGRPQYVCDAQMAFRQFVDAGLGKEVSNSFLIFASANSESLSRRIDSAEMWLASGQRLSKFQTFRRVIAAGESYRLTGTSLSEGDRQDRRTQWLINRGHQEGPVYPGTPLEDHIVAALVRGDKSAVASLIISYREFLQEQPLEISLTRGDDGNPFSPREGEQAVAGELVDCVPQNLISSEQGTLISVDHEWQVDGLCALDLVFLRGLLVVATRVAELGSSTDLYVAEMSSVMDVVVALAELAGLEVDEELSERLLRAEFEFQALVSVSPTGTLETFREGLLCPGGPPSRSVPTLRLVGAAKERDQALDQLASMRMEWDLIEADRDRILADRDRVARELFAVTESLESAQRDQEHLASANTRLRREVEALRRSSSFRLGRVITSPVRIALRRLQSR